MAGRAYSDTRVTVDKTRSDIGKLLVTSWAARGVQWEDDFDRHRTTIRFRWKTPEGDDVVVRLVIEPDPDASRPRSKADREAALDREHKRMHRVAFWWLKAMGEAVASGLVRPEAVMLPWVETVKGETVAELLLPRLAQVSSGSLHKALGPAKGTD